MATKPQAKAAVDSARTAINNAIDTYLPAGVDIIDGVIAFGPTRYHLTIRAVDATALQTLSTSVQTLLTNGSQAFVVELRRRGEEGRAIIVRGVNGNPLTVIIVLQP